MTAAQRATLEDALVYSDAYVESVAEDLAWVVRNGPSGQAKTISTKAFHHANLADALRAALGTCGTCAHAADRVSVADRYTFCSAPNDPSRFPFLHKQMPLGERCTGYTAKEGA